MSAYKRITTVDKIAHVKVVLTTSGTRKKDKKSWKLKNSKTSSLAVDVNDQSANRSTVNVTLMESLVEKPVNVKDVKTKATLIITRTINIVKFTSWITKIVPQ